MHTAQSVRCGASGVCVQGGWQATHFYPLDYINTHIHILTPIEGLALSLLDGVSRFSDTESFFFRLFPDAGTTAFVDTLGSIDQLVRSNVSAVGIGAEGILQVLRQADHRGDPVRPAQFRHRPG